MVQKTVLCEVCGWAAEYVLYDPELDQLWKCCRWCAEEHASNVEHDVDIVLLEDWLEAERDQNE